MFEDRRIRWEIFYDGDRNQNDPEYDPDSVDLWIKERPWWLEGREPRI